MTLFQALALYRQGMILFRQALNLPFTDEERYVE
jgi:hypothetical protein